MAARIVVTGSNGFIGQAFCKAARQAGLDIIALENRQDGAQTDGLRLDITDRASVRSLLRDLRPSHVLNFASRGVTRDQSTLAELLAVNTIGALNIVESLIEEGLAAHTFMFGTAYEYEDTNRRIDEQHRLAPQSGYAIPKTTLHYALRQYAAGAPLTFLRLFNVFGPGEPADRLIPFIARKAIAGESIPLTLGEQQRDFMFIDDLMAIVLRLLAPNDAHAPTTRGLRTFNIGTGHCTPLREFIEIVASRLSLLGLEPRLAFGALPYRAQDPMRCVCDNTALLGEIGAFPFIDLNDAIDRTVEALHAR
jgi:nucleoside-diphosphate-sugar epimerase